ncbi:elongation factor G [Lacticaseibacillus nasuensis]|uniref:elongation factor G n=1 Tax=Lacticaseibacillus nasuensis TaxID=944671 RepID=UPI0022478712|nr:TetM/TetW/TetO/TetS family tetracycline resistance ribosomal protection protein [Lacticaseibacillus nasuensis]MCX2455836.1 TetM/TetW/TetO/TetS family tetracycline resistance ribosomal protection protein [Lacticaseibacillus nasuensis]
MTQLVTGLVAHVDAGKTTLAEALLHRAGKLRQIGRVDKGDAFLDPDALEKARGITIFSHTARLQYDDLTLTLLDTPGHVDFASQTEQVLPVLDVAILVVSATAGVQGYTRTLWRLLDRYQVPTVIFVNKCDAETADFAGTLAQLQTQLGAGCLDWTAGWTSELAEAVAVQDDTVLADYLERGDLPRATVQALIARRQVIPVFAGSALRENGIGELLTGLNEWVKPRPAQAEFAAQVFKITHDKAERLTWLRVLGGQLQAKAMPLPEQKINQLRQYDGEKYTVVQAAQAGDIVAVTGLTGTWPGQGLGAATTEPAPMLQPVLTYALQPGPNDIHDCLAALRELEDEDPLLQVSWSEQLQELRVQLMGHVQLEILTEVLASRFHLTVSFDAGSILYRETVTKPVEGVGHFEPLRHYSEVHLRIEPLPRGEGIRFASECSLEVLGRNWQHQVLTALEAKTHLGVLIGAPLTDVAITLTGGAANLKHSSGGDFREATWRAVRQGLMMLRPTGLQLLEPWYQFTLHVPSTAVGRAMSDIQRMSGEFAPPETQGDWVSLTGTAPVSELQDYGPAVTAYTHGQGQLDCVVSGYRPAHDADAVIAAAGYVPTADLPNTPDSVFCAHGAGYPVAWDAVPQAAHCPYQLQP